MNDSKSGLMMMLNWGWWSRINYISAKLPKQLFELRTVRDARCSFCFLTLSFTLLWYVFKCPKMGGVEPCNDIITNVRESLLTGLSVTWTSSTDVSLCITSCQVSSSSDGCLKEQFSPISELHANQAFRLLERKAFPGTKRNLITLYLQFPKKYIWKILQHYLK